MEYEKKIEYWLDISNYDLETAIVMLEGSRFLYVGFMCHQAIEKILKGYYLSVHDDAPPFIHNLTLLARRCEIYDQFSDVFKDLIDTLEPLNVEARYPTQKDRLLQTLNYKRCKGLIDETRELHKWIKKRLSKK